MEHTQAPHWHHDRSDISSAPLARHDRPKKDQAVPYYPTLSDPYYSHSNAGSRPHSPPPSSHRMFYQHSHHQLPPQQQQLYHHHYHHNQGHSHHTPEPQHSYHHHNEDIGYKTNGEPYARRGHRYSTDSAAADTLLMLSAAAFMDPVTAQSVMADEYDKHSDSILALSVDSEHPYNDRRSATMHRFPQNANSHTTYSSNPRHYSPPAPELSRLLPMSKTVSAPASSSFLTRRSREMDADDEPGSLSPPVAFVLPEAAAQAPPTRTSLTDPADGSSTLGNVGIEDRSPPIRINDSKTARANYGQLMAEEGRVEENAEDEEDVVMSEGVVHVNAKLAPFSMSVQGHAQSPDQATRPFPLSISTMTSGQQQQGSPQTPTGGRTPRTPKQPKAPKLPKTPRTPKRSHSDYQGGSGGRGKNSSKDSSGDYFFSPFPPSASPASSPSSPSSLQAQLQQLTHNFVSVQPHLLPTGRFRRTPSSIITATATPSFSPPASPGLDLIRESSFQFSGLASTTTSPTKRYNGDLPTTPTLASFSRPGSKATTPSRAHFKPRWHTQPYMMFLALRAMPDRTAARQELIMAAVELDKKFSAEKGLPRVFTGKTPMNSASACLTNNGDKYFIPFKPEGSRSTHFRLAYEPGNFDTAANEYNSWMDQLIQHDWPRCFSVMKEDTSCTRNSPCLEAVVKGEAERPEMQHTASSPESRKRGADGADHEQVQELGNIKKVKAETEDEAEDATLQQQQLQLQLLQQRQREAAESREDRRVAYRMQKLDLEASSRAYNGADSCPPTPIATSPTTGPIDHVDFNNVVHGKGSQDLDLTTVPTSLADIVRVDVSSVPNAGNGLFAKIDLPAGTPLGFYFGVPMTENEFDSLKDGVGQASQYSIMYRRTVLDATDEQGEPYTDPNGRMYCPFHFMNEDPDGNVSFITGSIVNQVICTTNRNVAAGEELFVFYGREMDRNWATGAAASGSLGFMQGCETNAGEVGDGKRSRRGSYSHSRASSPVRKSPTEENGRPRRETVFKPARYTR
ncbi:hypothetical protein BGZ99_007729 [Dissophora globulifera]|uniref:SET domain-containing protein n=1 Tax=Dissophora globulifera TaxID=979702 RepID=A0A9P6RW68_9FUNG|nr:hypothetical protein BGZ99_007729 [Dissophora globulifera]